MVSAPLPPDENERLEDLQRSGLLDTAYEPVFDELTHLAAKICGVPFALISLVDRKRQWFKSVHGLEGVTETSRDASFCAHALLDDGVFYIPDTWVDERFHDNPLVTGKPNIRVYAGMPVMGERGHKLGTLCVLSDRPTPLSEWQLESLKQLSQVVTTLFRARAREARLAMLGQVLDQLNDEVIIAAASSLQCSYANASAVKGLGSQPANRTVSLPDYLHIAHDSWQERELQSLQSGQRDSVTMELARSHSGEAAADSDSVLELRLQRFQNNGTDAAIVAIARDVSERKRMEREQAKLHERLDRQHQQLSRIYQELSTELKLARDMQLGFLPAPRCMGRIRFEWLFHSSSYLSGDIFDYFPVDQRHLCFHVMDVSGHGLSAALLAFNAQRQLFAARAEIGALIQEAGGQLALAAARLAEEFNQRFYRNNKSSLYLTMIFGLIDRKSGDVALVQAGHPGPYLAIPGAPLAVIGEGGLPIGILEYAQFEAHAFNLAPGSRLFLYSDGITECQNGHSDTYGEVRLERLLQENAGQALDVLREALDNELRQWRGAQRGFADDITFVALENQAEQESQAQAGTGG